MKKILSFFKKGKSSPGAEAPRRETPKLITVYDASGRELQIPTEEWREKMLRPKLQSDWNDPDALYSSIVTALNDGLAEDVFEAAQRIHAIDTIPERGSVLLGVVLIELGRIDDAIAHLEDVVRRTSSAVAKTNLAKAYRVRGDDKKGQKLLKEAVYADPNQEMGFAWYMAEFRERHGDERAQQEMEQLAQIEGSWQPQVYLARGYLASRQKEEALGIYRDLLKRDLPGDALLIISGDLGNSGELQAMVTLLDSRITPSNEQLGASLNLLRAHVVLKNAKCAGELLDVLFNLQRPDIGHLLSDFAQQIDALKSHDEKQIEESELPQLSMLELERPIWLAGCGPLDWFFSPATDGSRILFAPFTYSRQENSDKALKGREDTGGRLSRTLPLYLAETLQLRHTAAAARIAVAGDGFAVFTEPMNVESLAQFGDGYDWLVSGHLKEQEQGWKLHLILYDANAKKVRATRVFAVPEEGKQGVLGDVLGWLDAQRVVNASLTGEVPLRSLPAKHVDNYLEALGQTLAVTLASNQKSGESLWNEKGILHFVAQLAEDTASCDATQIMMLTTFAKAKRYGSRVIPGFHRLLTERIMRVRQRGGDAARFVPLAFPLIGEKDALSIDSGADPEWVSWIEETFAESS